MILPVFHQGGLFLGTIIAGFILAFFYDMFRVARRIIPHAPMAVHIEDMLYWLVVAAVMFGFMLKANSGDVRMFSIVGTFIGMVLYALLLSSIFMKFSMEIYGFLRKIAIFLLTILLAPFKMIVRILSFPARWLKGKLQEAYAVPKKQVGNLKRGLRRRLRKAKQDMNIFFKNV